MTIDGSHDIIRHLDQDERVRSWTPRLRMDGMVQSPLTTSGVQILGVNTEREMQTTRFHDNMVKGTWLNPEVRHPVVIGSRLAERLNVEIGNRIVLSFQDLENELTSGAFEITGLFHTGSSGYDERLVIVSSDDLNPLLTDRTVHHEIAILLNDVGHSYQFANELNTLFPATHAETWYELSPELRYLTETGSSFYFYIMVVIMLALAFGILNTMLMAIFERMREIGMLMAVGMSKVRVFLMIMLESVILTVSGAMAGMLLAWLTVQSLTERGLDLTRFGGDTLAEWGYDALVYPVIYPEEFITISLLVIVTALLAAIYPSFKAMGLNPADVVREK